MQVSWFGNSSHYFMQQLMEDMGTDEHKSWKHINIPHKNLKQKCL
jgi:hypothetical protein